MTLIRAHTFAKANSPV